MCELLVPQEVNRILRYPRGRAARLRELVRMAKSHDNGRRGRSTASRYPPAGAMAEPRQNRLLSDGSKPPSIPNWVWVIGFAAFFAFMAFALSKAAHVAGFFIELWRLRAGG